MKLFTTAVFAAITLSMAAVTPLNKVIEPEILPPGFNKATPATIFKTHQSIDSPQKSNTDESSVNVRCCFDINPMTTRPWQILVSGDNYFETFQCSPEYDEEGNPIWNYTDLQVPSGVYDILCVFYVTEEGHYTNKEVFTIKEKVSIHENTELGFDPSKSTNVLSCLPVLPDGDTMKFGDYDVDDNWNFTEYSQGNIAACAFCKIVTFDGINNFYSQTTLTPAIYRTSPLGIYDPWEAINIYVNDVSENIGFGYFAQLTMPENSDQGTAMMRMETHGSTPTVMKNLVSTYRNVGLKWGFTPKGFDSVNLAHEMTEQGLVGYPFELERRLISGDSELAYMAHGSGFESPQVYNISASNDGNMSLDFGWVISQNLQEFYRESDEIISASNYGASTDIFDEEPFIMYFPYSALGIPVGGSIPVNHAPGNDTYRTAIDNTDESLFLSAPLLVSFIDDQLYPADDFRHNNPEAFDSPELRQGWLGRLGETRETDRMTAREKLYVGDELVAEGNAEEIMAYIGAYPVKKNAYRLMIDNSNFEAEGLKGGTVAELMFDTSADDHFPPSVTMLQFRDADDRVTSAFDSGEGAKMIVSAADLTCVQGELKDWGGRDYWFEPSVPAWISASIAPHGSDNFARLDLNEKPELFDNHGFGAFYEATLDGAVEEGWYDLLIAVGDDAGNLQMQTIALAFKIGRRLGIGNISTDAATESGVPVKYYTIDGRFVGTTAPWPGLYITVQGATVSKVAVR